MTALDTLLEHLEEPAIGQDIYFPTRMFLSRGRNDSLGGVGTVKSVKRMGCSLFVYVEELPGVGLNWNFLRHRQMELRKEFGSRRCRPDPDDHPSANTRAL